ncbi:MAG: hypothetical protein IPK78_03750 [Rhodospirillales bacterium]|nr:hypothetical protein [Rhodospirillales bacterium]
MLTIKTIAAAVALVVGTAAVTYTTTTTILLSEAVGPADQTCEALLAEMRAAKEEEKAKSEAFKKWSSGTPAPHGLGKGF